MVALMIATAGFAQITLVKDIEHGTDGSGPTELTVFDGNIYFKADYAFDANGNDVIDTEEDFGIEVVKSDGTKDGTVLLKDLKELSGNSSPNGFFVYGDYLYFNANPGTYGAFKTDGSTVSEATTSNGFGIVGPTLLNDLCYYRHTYTADGIKNELFQYDGTNNTAVSLAAGTPEEYIYSSIGFNNKIYAYMYWGDDLNVIGKELYAYDPENDSWELIKNIGEDDSTSDPAVVADGGISNFTILGEKLYFEALGFVWESDGTTEGTIQVNNISAIADAGNFYVWNEVLYFEGDNGTDGDQLYSYDPSMGTLTQLSNITGDHDPIHYAAPGDGYLYYTGKNAAGTVLLYRTDGTLVQELYGSEPFNSFDDIVAMNGVLYFEATDGSVGKELYKLDPATITVNDIVTGIEEELYAKSLSIYPNPTDGVINIAGLETVEAEYTLYDIAGRTVQTGITTSQITLDVATGIYILEVKDGNYTTTHKVQVK